MKKTVMLVFALVSAAAFAAVPVKWVVETSQLEPSTFDVVRGESLSIEANFMSYGSQLDMGRYPCSIFWQTNGMGSAWWIAPATVSKPSGTSVSNVVTAVFTPQMDPGTKTVSGFIGSTGEIYRAAFTLRFRQGPGATPNALPVPTKFIDWATVDNVNASAAPFALRGEGGLTSNDVARISAVTVTNDVAPWAMAGHSEPQGMTTNTVENIADNRITNSVQSGYLCTVETARGMTNGLVSKSWVSNNKQDRFVTKSPLVINKRNYQWLLNESPVCYTKSFGAEEGWAADAYADPRCTELYLGGGCTVEVPIGEPSKYRIYQSGAGWISDYLTDTPDMVGDELSINATTLSGYGITDAYTKTDADDKFLAKSSGFGPYMEWRMINDGLNIGGNTRMNALTMLDFDNIYDDNGRKLTSLTNSGAVAVAKAYADAENAATRAIVATWENFLDGSNVVFSITNYISGTYNLDAAKLRIMEMTNGVYREVYNSRDEILLHIDDFKNTDFRVATNQVIQGVSAAIADKADKAWGKYTSAGGEAPSNTVYMTAPQTVFAGGMEYERVAVGEGAVCILTTKGAPTYIQGDEGTFKFQDDGGTNYFGFAKTDSYVIGADASGISAQNNIVTIRYNVTMSGVPCIWYKADLTSNVEWEQLNLPDGTPVAGASHVVSWEATPPAGQEICYINCPEAKGFFKATIEVAGSAKFMTNMPADLSGGIFCTDGQHKVKINWNNGAPTLVPAN